MVTSASSNTTLVPQHILSRRASDLSRRIHRSMPWGYRLAGLFVVLAADSLDAFGRVMYAEFIKAVVRGMPETPSGKPAFDMIQDVHKRGADALPSGYGKPFASRVFKILLSRFGDPEVVEEAMAAVMLRAARGKIHIGNGSNLHEAESYVITATLNGARDVLRGKQRRKEVPLTRERDDEDATMDVEDPSSFQHLDGLITPGQMERLLRELASVHPRAPDWLRARLQGDSGQEIASEWGTTPSWVSKWQRLYLPRLKQVVEHHIRAARSKVAFAIVPQ